MSTNETTSALTRDLTEAIDELQRSLARASDAVARIGALAPRIDAVSGMLDEIASVLQSGRQDAGGAPGESYTRPTLLVANPAPEPATDLNAPLAPIRESSEAGIEEPRPQQEPGGDLICFRLEFQSSGGPLDLRAVDDAVGEHPAVRDVALLDYDGRNATLKVWIVATASPSEVEESLNRRAAEIFAEGSNVTIIALEDAA